MIPLMSAYFRANSRARESIQSDTEWTCAAHAGVPIARTTDINEVRLEADGGDAVLDVEPFGIDQPFLRDDRAVGVDHLLHAEIGHARRPPVAVMLDRAEEPEAGIGDADEIAARASVKRNADSAPKSRSGEVISSPPTNSSGPNWFRCCRSGTR